MNTTKRLTVTGTGERTIEWWQRDPISGSAVRKVDIIPALSAYQEACNLAVKVIEWHRQAGTASSYLYLLIGENEELLGCGTLGAQHDVDDIACISCWFTEMGMTIAFIKSAEEWSKARDAMHLPDQTYIIF
jgi:hypothetical protein